MNDFDIQLLGVDKDKLKNMLNLLESPCHESYLYKALFSDKNIIDTSPLDLYQNHFLLFHLLYKIQDDYYKINKYLHIYFSAIYLVDYPDNDKCRFYSEKEGRFCSFSVCLEQRYCELHAKHLGSKQLDEISSKYFYLDKNNYYKLDNQKANSFFNGTWELLDYYDEYQKALKILDLSENCSQLTLKRRFKELAKLYHPDMLESSISKEFCKINNAYRLILKLKGHFLS